jgi:trimeric autotransporter adhesin
MKTLRSIAPSASRRIPVRLVASLSFAFAALSAQAATDVWNSSTTLWETGSAWTPAGPPSATDIASFNPAIVSADGIFRNPTINSADTAASLFLANNFLGGVHTFTGTGTLTLGGAVTVRGVGTQTISGPILAGAAAGNLTFNVSTSAGLTLAGATTATTNSAAINLNGGTFTVDNSTNTTAKLNTSNPVSINGGGTFSLVGNASGTTLNLGNLTTTDNGLGGNNVVRVTPNGAATVVNFAATSTGSLRAGTRSTWDFQAASGNLGDANGAKITFTAAPFVSSANGLFANTASGATVGFATVTDALGKNFATYNTVGTTAIGVVSIANPGQSVATVTTVTNAAGLTGLSATAKGQFDAPTGTTTVSANIPALTLRVSPASGASLAIGSNGIAAAGIMLDGANDFAITGSTGVVGSAGTHYIYVNNPGTTLSLGTPITSSTNAVVFAGPGFVSLTGAGLQNNGTSGNNYRISITGGVLRGNNTQLELTNTATRGVINLYGGVLEITGGTNGTGASADFRRSLGTTAGNVNWGAGNADTGSGGFSAFGAAASVNIGGSASPASLIWNQTSFIGDGYALRFGSTKSNAVLTFLNPLGLDSGTPGTYAAREINVAAGVGGDKTVVSGVVSGSSTSSLIKTGAGTLEVSNANTYSGGTIVSQGTLLVTNSSGSGTGSAGVSVSSGATLGGSGTVSGATTLNGGTIGSAGNTLALGSTLATTGASTLAASSTVNVSGGTTITSGSFTVNGTLGGGVTVGGNTLNGSGTVNGTTTVNGGTIGGTLNLATLVATGSSSIAPTVNVSGGTSVSSGGTFTVNGTLASAITITSGATLKGSGNVTGATTIQSGGFLAPGNSPGLLTFDSALTLAGTTTMEILGTGTDRGLNTANGYDAINTGAGLLTYGGNLTVSFGSTTAAGADYDLFQIGAGSSTGSFGSVTIGGTYASVGNLVNTLGVWMGDDVANNLRFTFTESTGNLTVAAIPEPSAYAAAAGLGMMAFALYRRRRQQAATLAA